MTTDQPNMSNITNKLQSTFALSSIQRSQLYNNKIKKRKKRTHRPAEMKLKLKTTMKQTLRYYNLLIKIYNTDSLSLFLDRVSLPRMFGCKHRLSRPWFCSLHQLAHTIVKKKSRQQNITPCECPLNFDNLKATVAKEYNAVYIKNGNLYVKIKCGIFTLLINSII